MPAYVAHCAVHIDTDEDVFACVIKTAVLCV